MADVEMGEVSVVVPSLPVIVKKGGRDNFIVFVESADAHRRMPACV
jgi:hypothetical protein